MASLSYGPHAAPLPAWAEAVLISYLDEVGVPSALITSTYRSPTDQARAMYNNIVKYGVASQYSLYGPSGDKVIDAYVTASSMTSAPGIIQQAMAEKIVQVGPGRISIHCDPNQTIVDIDPGSIPSSLRGPFMASMEAKHRAGEIGEWHYPPKDPAYHIQLKHPAESQAVQAVENAADDVKDVFGGGDMFWPAVGMGAGGLLVWWLLG